jgi:acyl-CoA thioester hydrolase
MTNRNHDPRLPEFPVITPITIEWGQQDAFGHINNIHHFRWFETGRIDYLSRLGVAVKAQGVAPILAAISCNYRRQLNWPDEILIGTRVTRIGNTSLTVGHAIWSRESHAISAEGDSTVVIFDYEKQKPHPVPDELRRKISELEGRPL